MAAVFEAAQLAGMGREAEASARTRAKEWLGGLDFVSRDEFEAVKAMAARAREEAEDLKARVAALRSASWIRPQSLGDLQEHTRAEVEATDEGTSHVERSEPPEKAIDDDEREQVLEAFGRYVETIPEAKRAEHETFYEVKDVVGRSGFGIGSAGLPAYNVLLEGYDQALELAFLVAEMLHQRLIAQRAAV